MHCFVFLQALHCQVVLELFGILFKPRQPRWKNFPLLHSGEWHSIILSVGLALEAQTQMLLHCKAAWFNATCALCLVDDDCLLYLNSGNVLQSGQYHVLGLLAEPKAKHDRWNFPYGHSELLQVMTVSSFGARQKHTPSSLGLLMGKVHFLVYHLPRISGRIQRLQKASSFGTTVSQCFKSGWLRSLTICGSLSGLMAHTTKSQCFLSFKVNSYYCSWK